MPYGYAIFYQIGKRIMPKKSLFVRVILGGTVESRDEIQLRYMNRKHE